MATILGKPTDVAIGSVNPIELPTNSEPTPILRKSEVPKLPYSTGGTGDDPTYMVKANIGDGTPGFLDAKIGTNFSIVGDKITLANLTGFDTGDLVEGINLYYTQARFDAAFAAKTTTDLPEGLNLYYTEARVSANVDVAANTAARHTHSNKSVLDLITEPFTIELKAIYDAYSDGVVNGVTAPITFDSQIIGHSNDLGYRHIPDDTGVAQGWILSKGSSDGVYTWIENTSDAITLDATPTTSTTAAVQSAWVKNHNDNSLTDKNHLTDAQLTSVTTTFPNHISDASLHIPNYTVADANKYLRQNPTGTGMIWDDSDSGLSLSGETYLTLVDNELTAGKINISQTNLTQGTNVTIVGNVISSTQREIDTTPSTSVIKSISSSWASDHSINYGNKGHIPALATDGYFLAWDGSFKDVAAYVNEIDILDYVLGMQDDATLDPGIAPAIGDRYIILDITALNANFGTITGVGNNDIVEYDGAIFAVSFDSSAALASIEVTVTTDINANIDRQWYYSAIGLEWRDRGIASATYWSKTDNDLSPIDIGDSLLLPIGSKLAWDTGASYITATNTNVVGIYTDSTERLQINGSTIDANLPINVDTISENTASTGVTVEGALIKDNEITTNVLNIADNTYRIEKDGSSNLTFTDPISGTVTLATLLASAAVTSVGLSIPTGFTVSNTPITSSGVIALGFDTGYSLPTDLIQSTWDSAYAHSQITTGNPHALNNADVGLGSVENTALSTYTGNGGALDNQYIANGAEYLTASSTAVLTNKSGSNSQWTNDEGYLTSQLWNQSGNTINYTAGNVGIGTSSPSEKLSIDKALDFQNNGSKRLTIEYNANSGYGEMWGIDTLQGIYIGFETNKSVIVVRNNGNVGIADTSPSYRLDVNGTGRFTDNLIVPTQSTSDDSTYAASTAFVKAQGYITGVTETVVQVKTASFTAVGGVPYRIEGSSALTATVPVSAGDRVAIVNASTAITTVGALGDLAAGDSCVLYYDSTWKEYTNTLT